MKHLRSCRSVPCLTLYTDRKKKLNMKFSTCIKVQLNDLSAVDVFINIIELKKILLPYENVTLY